MTRLAAFLLDSLLIWSSFILTAAGAEFVIEVFATIDAGSSDPGLGILGAGLLLAWAFVYFALSFALAGRTLGMALIGLRVTTRQGDTISARQAMVRTAVFPLSFVIFGLGFLGIFTSPERRTLHDSVAGSVVVYDWGDRTAEIPAPLTKWVDRRVRDETDNQETSN